MGTLQLNIISSEKFKEAMHMHVGANKDHKLINCKSYQVCLMSSCNRTIHLLNRREMIFIASVDLGF